MPQDVAGPGAACDASPAMSTRRPLTLLGPLALVVSCATAASSGPGAGPAWGREADLARGPLLWDVQGPKGGVVHLFGTMHTESTALVPRVAWERFASAPNLAFEVDPEAPMDPAKLATRVALPAGQSLDQMLGPEAWQKLTTYLRGFMGGMFPPPALARLRPWFVTSMIVMKMSGFKIGDEVMDMGLAKRGRAEGKKVHFLETMEQQLDVLASTIDADELKELVMNLDALPALFTSMADAYRAGDVAALQTVVEVSAASSKMSADDMRVLLGARNERWVPFLEKLAAEGGGFVAVGAAHLPGKDGLVALMRARGYRVTRVSGAATASPQTPDGRTAAASAASGCRCAPRRP